MGERTSRYVYGPVPSRRLGQSLGVDLVPLKTCNCSCVYCQLGRTSSLTCERGRFVPIEELLAQLRVALASSAGPRPDYVTLVGQGEPTLSLDLGAIVDAVKALSDAPLAVITNGTLLYLSEVRDALQGADLVMPSLDAADERMWRRINRPCRQLELAQIIEGMARFRKEFSGQIWLEVMLMRGLNDDALALRRLGKAIAEIQPDRVQVNVPVRPPAEDWVHIPDDESVMQAMAILGQRSEAMGPYDGHFHLGLDDDPVQAVLAIISRHPMRQGRLLELLSRLGPDEADRVLRELRSIPSVRQRVYEGQTFWQVV